MRAALIVVAALVPVPAQAAGDLLVAPQRVVLDGARGTEVILNNIGSQPATYRISLELRRMNRDGRLDEVAEPQANSKEQAALAMLSYAPRRVVLAPNQPQAVRIGVRAPDGLPDGEYRAHMLFRAVPEAAPPTATTAKGVSVQLTMIYGVTIPIIVRKGSLQATAALSDPRRCTVQESGNTITQTPGATGGGSPALCFTLAHGGERSTYGQIRVTRPGLKQPLVQVRGIAAYPEISARTVSIPLDAQTAAQFPGPVKIEYLEDDAAGGGTIAALDAVIR